MITEVPVYGRMLSQLTQKRPTHKSCSGLSSSGLAGLCSHVCVGRWPWTYILLSGERWGCSSVVYFLAQAVVVYDLFWESLCIHHPNLWSNVCLKIVLCIHFWWFFFSTLIISSLAYEDLRVKESRKPLLQKPGAHSLCSSLSPGSLYLKL